MIIDAKYLLVKAEVIQSNLHTFFSDQQLDDMTEESKELVAYIIAVSGDPQLAKKILKSFKEKREGWRYAI